ncbi:regulator of telomere elongation helicase 1-like isoform X2 [Biomphalaria glabrata]|nr:regulator of telomere elongation helicase 1-like isoform X2 [Biomphalaria glabrata]XP_055886516.1 regulator of telomere elongation helicase 1-like isoform X2 [Biomphalaria glabrata]XP_055886518.1 regulator of telomere elongation helicase 1-like isoform X2 [Biomphalaria glabrata]XP_055886519.1 regulator of telomere elongation helicase 1-like isoform X2 [Biomphalaria glabrata]XP_055886520.1 regulator of telomere elongation helicase 1-like isoform X2 [Biomphalaria glabrata]XP_055886521.1 regul
MPLLDLNGVQVSFPFTPYPCQIDYMSKVLTCLQKNQNGVLESPTGTGKTLSLLCASLAWQESHKAQVELNKQTGLAAALSSSTLQSVDLNKISQSLQTATGSSWGSSEFLVPRIIYASRTHSQLSQAVQELKRTAYSHVKSSVIGSREQLCIHQQVQKLTNNTAKVHMCRAKVTARNCHFYNNIEEFKKKSEVRKVLGSVVDIEDLVKTGHKTKTCPYYMARELKSDSDIVFMPYNYLLDQKSRKAHGVELQGSIIIFDEAHNLEKICEESASFDLSSLDIATAIEETTKLAEKIAQLSGTEAEFSQVEASAILPDFNLEDIIRLKKTLLEIEEKLDTIEVTTSGKTLPGSFIFEFLSQVNITWSTKNSLIDVLDQMTSFLSNDEGNSLLHTKGSGLSKISDCLKIVFNQEPNESMSVSSHQTILSQHFRVFIQKKEPNNNFKKKIDSWVTTNDEQDKKVERVLSYWCFSPGHTMKDLLAHGVKVIILTSGTLSPLESFTMEMQIPFPVQLENPHVIDTNQVWLGALCKGPDGAVLNSEYKNRSTEEYQNSLGNSIVNFARVVPNGLLIFFPSYPLMDQCVEKWKRSNVWNNISQYKPIVVEPKGKFAFTEVMDEFYSKVNDPSLNGAIFMAVCRGKVSEGLDFADHNGRAVMITGLPFPPMFDPRVKLKMEFLRDNASKFNGLSGQLWYRQQATRAVNQAIGRVIRHNKDYGAIILCDKRFSSLENRNALPLWVRHQAQIYNTFGPALRDIIKFFKEAEAKFPAPSKPVKSNKSADSGIISGAFFEPSTSSKRPARIAIQYEKACDVPCHVPSLKSSEEEASIYEQYSAQKSKTAKKRTLLEALETSEDQNHGSKFQTVVTSGASSLPSLSQQPVAKLPGNQKKIKIKKTELVYAETEEETVKKVELVRSKMSLESCKEYVNEVKSVLNKETYRRFSEALVQYKKENDIHNMIPVLAEVFTTCPEHHHLMQKFHRYVRPKDKDYFARTCFELTGIKIESNTNRYVASCSTKTDANRSTSAFSEPASLVGSVPAACNPSTSSTTQPGSNDVSKSKKAYRGYIPHYKNYIIMSSVNLHSDGNIRIKKNICHANPIYGDFCGQHSDMKKKVSFQYDDRATYQELVDCGIINPNDGIYTPDMFVYPRTWENSGRIFTSFPEGETILSTCIICKGAPVNGLRHECGAVCCFMCWKSKIFEGPPERKCPYPHCGARVKRKHLQQVVSADGGSGAR